MVEIANPKGAFGQTAHSRTVETFIASGAVAVNEPVCRVPATGFSHVEKLDEDDTNVAKYFVGVAVAAAADGEAVEVVTRGPVTVATSGTASAGNYAYKGTSGNDGTLTGNSTATVGTICGVFLTGITNNTATVDVWKG